MAEQSRMSRRVGNPNTDVYINGRQNNITFPFGLNVYNDPGFANPNDLPTTAPNCSDTRTPRLV
jgi:hypothetical protein